MQLQLERLLEQAYLRRDSDLTPTTPQKSHHSLLEQPVDIAFLYADVLVYRDQHDNLKAMKHDTRLSADVMY
jgi:hypothetical protein